MKYHVLRFFAEVIRESFVLKWILLETYCDLVGSETPLTFPVHISLLLTEAELANSPVEECDLLVLQKNKKDGKGSPKNRRNFFLSEVWFILFNIIPNPNPLFVSIIDCNYCVIISC